MSKYRNTVIALLILASLGLGVYALVVYRNGHLMSIPKSVPNLVSNTSATSSVDTTGWQTYRNDEYGFEMQIPAGQDIGIDRGEKAHQVMDCGGGLLNENDVELCIYDVADMEAHGVINDGPEANIAPLFDFNTKDSKAEILNKVKSEMARQGRGSDNYQILSTFKFTK